MQPHAVLTLKTFLTFLLVAISSSTTTLIIDKGESANLQSLSYSVEQVPMNGAIEYRFKLDNRHFGTLINQGGTFAFRPHSGCDINGWGSTWYAQPFLPNAELKHTTIGATNADSNGIHVGASGMVSHGASNTYGTWSSVISFTYDPVGQVITGAGQYTVTLAGPLSSATGDLNLYKIASNYLDNVPLLSGDIGDTGDMTYADIRACLENIHTLRLLGSESGQLIREAAYLCTESGYSHWGATAAASSEWRRCRSSLHYSTRSAHNLY